MSKLILKRQVPISRFYQEVCLENTKLSEDGFMMFSQDLCDRFGVIDPEFKKDTGWESAFGQYIYVEYCLLEEDSMNRVFMPLTKDKIMEIKDVVRIGIISCENSVSMEIIMEDNIGGFCFNSKKSKNVWNAAVQRMAILLKLYDLNKQGKDSFWRDVLDINKHLGFINESPVIRILSVDKNQNVFQLCSKAFNSTVPLPRKDDCMEISIKGCMQRLKVKNVIFNYETPFGKLGEIKIETERIYDNVSDPK